MLSVRSRIIGFRLQSQVDFGAEGSLLKSFAVVWQFLQGVEGMLPPSSLFLEDPPGPSPVELLVV